MGKPKVDRLNSVHPLIKMHKTGLFTSSDQLTRSTLIRSTPHLRPPPGAARPPFRHERGGIARPRSSPQSRRDRNGHERRGGFFWTELRRLALCISPMRLYA